MEAKFSRFQVAIVAHDHVKQHDPRFFTADPIGLASKERATVIADPFHSLLSRKSNATTFVSRQFIPDCADSGLVPQKGSVFTHRTILHSFMSRNKVPFALDAEWRKTSSSRLKNMQEIWHTGS
jgi:hypothetical protein